MDQKKCNCEGGCSCEMGGKKWKHTGKSGGGMVYCMGVIGALIYSLQNATSFTDGLFGVFQSLFWPAFLAYKAFELLKF